MVDYGLSVVKPSSTTKAKGYTEYFAAPEQVDGRVPLPESDLYGLAKTMIFALGGDVETLKVPDRVPDYLCAFIKTMLKQNPLARPNWDKEDLCETIKEVRHKCFGRAASNMKPLDMSWYEERLDKYKFKVAYESLCRLGRHKIIVSRNQL